MKVQKSLSPTATILEKIEFIKNQDFDSVVYAMRDSSFTDEQKKDFLQKIMDSVPTSDEQKQKYDPKAFESSLSSQNLEVVEYMVGKLSVK
jgi:hypothetical protein